MISARVFIKKATGVTPALRLFGSRTTPSAASAAHKSAAQMLFAAETSPGTASAEKLVRDAIENMMKVRRDDDAKPILDGELESKFRHFQNLYHEATSCIADLREAGDNIEEEMKCANSAVDLCFNSFVELLEDLRRANETQLEAYSDVRLENAKKLKELRRELDEMKETF